MGDHTILIVDDDYAIGELISSVLEDEGYSVRSVTDGASALHVMQETPPALILLDYQLPCLNGAEIVHCMQARDTLRSIPVIIGSAFDPEMEWFDGHVQAIVRKPFDLNYLRALIAQWMPSDK